MDDSQDFNGNKEQNQTLTLGKLAEALAKAQAGMEGAKKDSENPFFHQKYADLASIWDACRKPLSDNGLSVIQTTDNENGKVVIITTLIHSSGEWVRGKLAIKPMKEDPQALGSAITYGRRYALAAIVGVSPEEDDAESTMDRGKNKSQTKTTEPQAPVATDKQKRMIWARLKELVADETIQKAMCFEATGKESSSEWLSNDIDKLVKYLAIYEKTLEEKGEKMEENYED